MDKLIFPTFILWEFSQVSLVLESLDIIICRMGLELHRSVHVCTLALGVDSVRAQHRISRLWMARKAILGEKVVAFWAAGLVPLGIRGQRARKRLSMFPSKLSKLSISQVRTALYGFRDIRGVRGIVGEIFGPLGVGL